MNFGVDLFHPESFRVEEKMDYNFKRTIVSDAVENKLLIKKLPDWMQKSVQIQKFFDDAIQPLFNSTQQKIVDGYIGDRGTPAALGKVFIEETSTDRTEYQLSPVYCSKNDNDELTSIQFYPDLIKNLQHNGSITYNQNRLLSGAFYSWDPPINKNKMINYSHYFWDTNNKWGITDPDYVVMQRGADNGNLWSIQNYWYTVGDKLENGSVATNEIFSDRSRFKQAQAPIIEFYKNIEIMNSGTKLRTTVDYMEDTYIPEDFMLKRVGDGAKADGINIKHGDRILFTSIGNPGENNRIYRVNGSTMGDGSIQLGLVLDEKEISSTRITGEPMEGDVIIVNYGKTNGAKTVYWDGASWKQTATKTGINIAPPFVLYDLDGVRLDDQSKYPNSTFTGNPIFYFKINYDYDYNSAYQTQIETNTNGYPMFESCIDTAEYKYLKGGEMVKINSIFQYNILTDVGISTEAEIYYRAYSPNHDKGLALYGTTTSSIGKNFTIKVSNSSYIKNLYPNGTKNDNYLSYGQDGIWKYDINDKKLKIGTEVQTEYTGYDITTTASVSGEKLTAVGKLYKVRMPKVLVDIPSIIIPVEMDDWNHIYITEYDTNEYANYAGIPAWSGTGSPNESYDVYIDLSPVNGLNQKTTTETYKLGSITVGGDGNWVFDPMDPSIPAITDELNDVYSVIEYLAFYYYRANVRFVHTSGTTSTKRIYCVYPYVYQVSFSDAIPRGLTNQYELADFGEEYINSGPILYDYASDTGYISLDLTTPVIGWSYITYSHISTNGKTDICTLSAELSGDTGEYQSNDLIYERVMTLPNMLSGTNKLVVIKKFTFDASKHSDDNVVMSIETLNFNEHDYKYGMNSHYAGVTIDDIKIGENPNINIFVNSTRFDTTNALISGDMGYDVDANAYTLSWVGNKNQDADLTKMVVAFYNTTSDSYYSFADISSANEGVNIPVVTYHGHEYLQAKWFGSSISSTVLPYQAIENAYGAPANMLKRLHGNISLSSSINATAKKIGVSATYLQYTGTRTVNNNGYNRIGVVVINDNMGTVDVAEKTVTQSYNTTGLVRMGSNSTTLLIHPKTKTVTGKGSNTYGGLKVSGWTDIVAVSAGSVHSLGLTSTGTVVAAGTVNGTSLTVGEWSDVVSIEAGHRMSFGVKSDGTVLFGGPTGSPTKDIVLDWSNIKQITTSSQMVFGLTKNGTVFGIDSYGADASYSSYNTIGWTNIKTILGCSTNGYLVGLKNDGTVVLTGVGIPVGADVSGWTDIISVACSTNCIFGLKSNGTLVATGVEKYFSSFRNWTNIVEISASVTGLIGVKSDGSLVSDGYSTKGHLNISGINLFT